MYPRCDRSVSLRSSGRSRLLPGRVLQPEDGHDAALVRELARVAEGAERAETGGRILGTDPGGHADTGPATDARVHGDVLRPVRSGIGHRVADDARRGLVLPEDLPGLGVDALEPAFHGAVEDQAAGRGKRPAVRGEVLLDLPDDLALHRIPGDEPAAIPAGARKHPHDRADVRLTGGVLDFDALVVHADVVCRDVEEAGLRRVRRRLLILEADGGRADALAILLRGGAVLRILDRDAGFDDALDWSAGAAALGPVDRAEGVGDDDLAVGAVDGVADAVPVEVAEQLLAAALEQDVLVDTVVVPLIVGGHLIGPLRMPGVRLRREDGHRPLVVARPLVGVPGPRVADAVVEEVELGVVGIPAPGGATAALPLIALPGGDAE